jgi:hypothetical protein
MEPGIGPIDADAVLIVDFLACVAFFQCRDDAIGVFAAAGELGFDDLIARNLRDELADGEVGGGHELENVGHPDETVAAGDDSGVDDAAVAFAADNRAMGEHGLNDVGFADGGADDLAFVGGGNVIEHSAGGEIGDGDAGAAGKEPFGAEDEGIFFADVFAGFVDDGEAIGVGILGEADGGVMPADFIGEGDEVFFGGFGFVGEAAIGDGV